MSFHLYIDSEDQSGAGPKGWQYSLAGPLTLPDLGTQAHRQSSLPAHCPPLK